MKSMTRDEIEQTQLTGWIPLMTKTSTDTKSTIRQGHGFYPPAIPMVLETDIFNRPSADAQEKSC